MTKTRLPLCAVLLLGCTSSPNFDPAEHSDALDNAQLRMQAGEVDEALIITDRLLVEDPDNRDAHLLAAQGSLALSELGRTNTPELIADGIRHYESALELNGEDAETWLVLSRAYLKNAQFPEGVAAALQAATLLQAEGASGARIAEAVLAAADNEMQIFVEARNEEFANPDELDPNGAPVPSPGTLALASAVFSRLDYAKPAAPGPAYSKSAVVYQWLGQLSNALSELERGLDAAPDEPELHIAYQGLHLQMDRRPELVAAYRRLARERTGVSMVQFYLGRAHALLGDRYREQGDWEQASQSYEAARETFAGYRDLEPRNREATDVWLAICNLSLGRVDYEMGNLNRAVEHYVAAYENDPQVTEFSEDGVPLIYDTFGGNYISGLDMVARARGVGNGADALAERLAQYEWIIERHPDEFGNIYNNAGFLARDLGMAIELRGNRPGATDAERTSAIAEAMELWEKSYAYYVKAVELSPMDPRIVNDCGVMLVYHLKRDYDHARELFDRTIEIGQPMIDSLTDSTSQEEREFLEEAVGDAYQNIAVMMHDLDRPFEEYRSDLEKAITYFPYQRREAAAMLRNDGRRPAGARGATAALGGLGSQDPQDPRKAAFDQVIVEASAMAEAGDLDGALLVLDGVTREMTGYAPFHYYLGLYSFRYGNQARDAGGSAMQVEGLYADATRHLQRAVDLDSNPVEPRLALSQAYYETGDFAGAARESESLLRAMQASGESDPETLAACQMVTAQACSRVFIEAKQAGDEDPQNFLAARNAFRSLEASDKMDESLFQAWSVMEQWAGANAEALAITGRAAEEYRESGELHQRIIDLGSSGGLGQNAVDILKNRRDAFGLWYLGRARFALSEQQWMGSKLDEAIDELDTAAENFRASMAANPAYADSSEQWVALCLGKKGVILMAQDLAAAEKALLEAAALRPDRIEESLGGTNTVKRSLQIIGDRYYQADDLLNAQRLFGEASKAVPEDVDFANNYGLFARDYGTELERDGSDGAAKEMFEASYEAYTLASSLEPDNVRLLNDRALMLVHHLKRDWDIALQCLEKGIELGEQQWQNPPEDEDEREVLEEAIGDCYENLGLYHLEHTGDLDKAEENYKKALTFYPKERRPGSRRGLRQVEERRKIRN